MMNQAAILSVVVLALASCAQEELDGCVGGLVVEIQAAEKVRVRYATDAPIDAELPVVLDECAGLEAAPFPARAGALVTLDDVDFGRRAPQTYSLVVEGLGNCTQAPVELINRRAAQAPAPTPTETCSLSEVTVP